MAAYRNGIASFFVFKTNAKTAILLPIGLNLSFWDLNKIITPVLFCGSKSVNGRIYVVRVLFLGYISFLFLR